MPITETDVEELLTKDEAAHFLHVSRSTIDRMMRNHELDYVRIGSGVGRVRFTKRALLDHLNGRSVRADRNHRSRSGRSA